MCRQVYIRYPRCGCELRHGPLKQCAFGRQDPRCDSVTNVIRPDPTNLHYSVSRGYCPYHTRFYLRLRPFTLTPRGFELWAGGHHEGVYWPISKNQYYYPRSWDFYGRPPTADKLYDPYDPTPACWTHTGCWNTQTRREFGLVRAHNWDLEMSIRRTARRDGYAADDEAPVKGPDARVRRGRRGVRTIRRRAKQLRPTTEDEREELDERSDGWLDIGEEEIEAEAYLLSKVEPMLMWGHWDGKDVDPPSSGVQEKDWTSTSYSSGSGSEMDVNERGGRGKGE